MQYKAIREESEGEERFKRKKKRQPRRETFLKRTRIEI